MTMWITLVAVILIIAWIIAAPKIKKNIEESVQRKRENCEKSESGHDFDGCVCKKCGKENHEWEDEGQGEDMSPRTAKARMIERGGAFFDDGNKVAHTRGAGAFNKHKCKRCGKIMKNKVEFKKNF